MSTSTTGRWTRRTFWIAMPILVPVLFASCAGGPHLRATPDPAALALPCSDAYVLDSQEEHPTRIRVSNQTSADLLISLDECVQTKHLGWVRAGTVTTLALPSRLVGFDGKLRVDAYAVDADRNLGTFDVEPFGFVARLVIPASADADAR